ncbi:hypothetical protein ABL78_3312 [Leptomonas seymouri]|uniref:Uncharacterized protein n=1 Tax=Leptomonas seymouri TaxID=5684 RepID=A0A0N1HZQ1_LEPSE|nr:hypothetical protein ABL78_3312 [Leptomonas seymouri]|eukprot:KPI87603.1 hypothetical protein ABL78_3312 [Leptomonas seymouri]
MFRLRPSAAPPRLALRHFGYYPSAWSACTSPSISRYFHCTLKKTLQREEDGACAVAPSPSTTRCAVQRVTADIRTASHDRSSFPSARAFTNPTPPTALHYSLELSLPHLPERTPFRSVVGKDPDTSGDHDSHVQSLLALSASKPPAQADPQQGQAEWLHPRWSAFVQLCDAIVAIAASHQSTKSAVARLSGVILPCKEPYFAVGDPAPEGATTTSAASASTLSTTQAAILLLQQHWHVPVTLALNTSLANRHVERGWSDPTDNAAGASSPQVEAVVHDFTQRLGGRQLLLVRGDAAPRQHDTPRTPSAHAELRTGADLIRCVSRALNTSARTSHSASSNDSAVQIAVAGYPQGHPLDREWDVSVAAATTTAGVTDRGSSVFFDRFERSFNAADDLFKRMVVSHVQPSPSQATSAPLPALHRLFYTLGRLHAVRQLWLTPSRYSAEARAACTRQLIEDKVLLRGSDAQGSFGGAHVIVTQMLASAQEFTAYVDDVQRALKDVVSSSPSSAASSHAAVKIIPGILLPHPTDAHVLLRSLYYSKVIPSTRLQRALETYRADLKSLWRSIAVPSTAATEQGSAEEIPYLRDVANGYMSTWPGVVVLDCDNTVSAVEAAVQEAHDRAGARFAAAWMAETVDLLSELRQRSGEHTPVHFFTMFNGQVDVRLAQLLDAYAAQQRSQQPLAVSMYR